MKKTYAYAVLALLLVIIAGLAAIRHKSRLPATLEMRFGVVVDGESLVRNQVRYANPGGDGKFKIRDFQFFISNIKLISKAGDFVETDSYHLARFDNESQTFTISLSNIPRRQYQKIEFSIGVDAVANGSIASVGDLDPNGRMAWNWEAGYKFILFEGALIANDVQYPLVYHVGFDDNYKQFVFPLDTQFLDRRDETLVFEVDVIKLFKGASTIDMTTLSNVKFDKVDAKLIADNYERMIELLN